MASYLPHFTVPMSEVELTAGIPSELDLIDRLGEVEFRERCWMASSRNDWFRVAMRRLIEQFVEYAPLEYVTRKTTVLRSAELPEKIAAWRRLLADIEREPSRIREDDHWTGYRDYGAQELLEFFRKATVSRKIHEELDGELYALFSFMKSQPEALQGAFDEGRCVFCLQME